MKRLYTALALLVIVFLLAMCNAFYLGGMSREMAALLTEAEKRGDTGDWDSAMRLTRQAEEIWEEHDLYLHITLHHTDTDHILLAFREVKELLLCREEGEYSAANAVLIGQIDLLWEQEQLSLKNIL